MDDGLRVCSCGGLGGGSHCGDCGEPYEPEKGDDCPNPDCEARNITTKFCPHCGEEIVSDVVVQLRTGELTWEEFEADFLAAIPRDDVFTRLDMIDYFGEDEPETPLGSLPLMEDPEGWQTPG